MKSNRTAAVSASLVLVTTVTAVALNIGVLRATRSDSQQAAVPETSDEAELTTLVFEVPGESTTTTVKGDSAPADLTSVPAPSSTAAAATAPAPSAQKVSTEQPPATTAAATATEAPSTTAAPRTKVPRTTTAPSTTTASQTTTTAAAPATEYLNFGAGAAGEVVIANHGDSLEFWAAYTTDGWQYQVENPVGKEVTVKFLNPSGGEAQFTAKLENGRVTIESEGLGGGGG